MSTEGEQPLQPSTEKHIYVYASLASEKRAKKAKGYEHFSKARFSVRVHDAPTVGHKALMFFLCVLIYDRRASARCQWFLLSRM